MKVKEAKEITGSLTRTSKMPGLVTACQRGNAKRARSSGIFPAACALAVMP